MKAANTKTSYWDRYYAAREVFDPYCQGLWQDRFGGLGIKQSVLGLVDRLIDVGKVAA